MAPQPHPPLTPFGSALAGALGSVFANAAVYPLDTVKTRLQAEDEEDDENNENSKEELPITKEKQGAKQHNQITILKRYVVHKVKNWGMLMMLIKIIKNEGLAGAFHGFGASMIGTFSQQFAYFFFHTLLRTSYLRRLSSRSLPLTKGPAAIISPATISTPIELLIGALAGALASIFTIPVQVIATRQQLWHPPSTSSSRPSTGKAGVEVAPSLYETAQEIINENGITGLWTGLKPGLVLTVNPAITYGAFERLKSWRLASRNSNGSEIIAGGGKLGVAESFWLGVTSKMLATVVTYPYIFAKVRLQAKATPEEIQYDAEHPRSQNPSEAGSGSLAVLPSSEEAASRTDERPGSDTDKKDQSENNPTPSYASIASAPPAFGSATVDLPKQDPETESKAVRPTLNKKHSHKYHHHHRHALSLLKAVYKEHGFKGWYKGLGAQIVKAVLCQGILFVSKDQFESYAWILLVFLTNLRKRLSPF